MYMRFQDIDKRRSAPMGHSVYNFTNETFEIRNYFLHWYLKLSSANYRYTHYFVTNIRFYTQVFEL